MGELKKELTDHTEQLEAKRKLQLDRRKSAARIAEVKAKDAQEAKEKMLLKGFDMDEDSDKSVAEQLRDALSKSAVRVIDLFDEWDTDGNGQVSKKEFRKAMSLLGFTVPIEDIDALFDSWDPDGSGLLSMGELQKELTDHKERLEAQRKSAARIAEVKAKEAQEAKEKMLLKGFDMDEDSDKSVAEQLRDALSKSAVRVIDLFNEW